MKILNNSIKINIAGSISFMIISLYHVPIKKLYLEKNTCFHYISNQNSLKYLNFTENV